jgi:hypothetical protein
MREILECSQAEEHKLINNLGIMLRNAGFNASNSTLVAVSSDYSSIAWQVLRHFLSHDGEVCDGFTVDVPYPDQAWSGEFERLALQACKTVFFRDNLILIEAGVIRGSNYRRLCDLIHKNFPGQVVVTSTVFENVHSAFKSEFVARYYDDETQDLTFWWEAYNKHWPIDIQERKRLASKAVWGSGVCHAEAMRAKLETDSVPLQPMVGTRLVTPMILVDENDVSSHGSHCPGMAIGKDDAVAGTASSSVATTPAYQPIASAPKDGTRVFVWLDEVWVAAKWRKELNGHWQSAYSGRFLTTDPGEIEWWMPHPEPPEPEVRG